MVSSKYLTAFSDFRLPEDAPDFLPVNEYLAYLKAYVKHFGLEKHIHLNTKVTSVRPFLSENGTRRHEVTTRHVRKKAFDPASLMAKVQLDESMLPSVSHCHAVVVSSGLHVTPCIPTIPGLVEPATKVDQDGQTEGEDRSFTTNPVRTCPDPPM